METLISQKIRTLSNEIRQIPIAKSRAEALLNLLVNHNEQILNVETTITPAYSLEQLDVNLKRFYLNKEIQLLVKLLNHFIENGDFNYSECMFATKYKHLKDLAISIVE